MGVIWYVWVGIVILVLNVIGMWVTIYIVDQTWRYMCPFFKGDEIRTARQCCADFCLEVCKALLYLKTILKEIF